MGSSDAYSCSRVVRMYFGSCRLALMDSFSIRFRRSNCDEGVVMNDALPYSERGRI